MIAEIAALLGLANTTAGTISGAANAVKDIRGMLERPKPDITGAKAIVSDLYDKVIQAQSDHIAIKGALLDLKEEQRRIDDFKAQAARYALVKTDMGALVYELRESEAHGEPTHCLCTACYEKQVKSILQPAVFNTLECPVCGAKFLKGDGRQRAAVARISRGYDVLDPYGDGS